MPSPALTKLRNAGWLLLERGVSVLIAFFVTALVARHLGPATFGSYAYMFALVALFLPLVQFGQESIVMRNLGRRPDDRAAILGSSMAIQFLGGLLSYGVAITLVALFGGPQEVSAALMMLAGLQLLAAPLDAVNNWFRAQERMIWIVLPRIVVALAVAIAALTLVLSEAPLAAFVALRGLESILFAVAAALAFAVTTGALSGLRVSRAELSDLVRDGWPMALSAVAVAIYMRVDQVMLGHLSGDAELGQYSIAVRVADVALIVPIALRASFFASIIRAHDRGADALWRHTQHVYDAMALGALGTMVLGAAGSLWLFVPIFGADYGGGLSMTLVLLLGLPWVAFGLGRSAMLVARGWLWTAPATTAIGAAINVLLNLMLIPRFGGLGAAWATVISYWIAAHGSCFAIAHLRRDAVIMTRSLNVFAAAVRLQRKLADGNANA